MEKFVYRFEEGSKDMKELLGGKGANLAEMTNLGLPVPKGFTVTTAACNAYLKNGNTLSLDLQQQIWQAYEELLAKSPSGLPLLVSVRSGAAISMPGMMDTILNLGLNDRTVEELSSATHDARFAYDCYRRLLQMFGDVVYGLDKDSFENAIASKKRENGVEQDTELTAEDWQSLCKTFQKIYQTELNKPFPQEPKEQLFEAVEAVFGSWKNPRARVYRELHSIPHDLGTAVNVQQMVFGNAGEDCGTGVAFTRNPATGEKALFGEFLVNAQGEDVVAGIRTPLPIERLKEIMPEVHQQFLDISERLEKHYKDMQDIEFTIEKGVLYFLQTRNGKRTAHAAIRAAVEMVKEGLIDKKTALLRIDPDMISQILHPIFDPVCLKTKVPISQGLPASPGAACGQICFAAEEAKKAKEQGRKVILVRQETSPEDIEGMIAAEAIVTSRGGMTSHAAVVARGMGKCCVAGCGNLQVIEEEKSILYPGGILRDGYTIAVDGSTGSIYLGEIPTVAAEDNPYFNTVMEWSKEIARLGVRANADTPHDLQIAIDFGAEGVGLVRTEHMFFSGPRLLEMRRMILAQDEWERSEPLKNLLEMQRGDFTQIYRMMGGRPVTIRLLDPPLHEFLPHSPEEIHALAELLHASPEKIALRVKDLSETNPMLGHRGCRLAITYPDIYEMQVEAIVSSALALREEGLEVNPEIMIPLIDTQQEIQALRQRLESKIQEWLAASQQSLSYQIGTMIELPRACLVADKIAEYADFFSFGTNDLTQMTFGFSRDDVGKFLGDYLEQGILEHDPFQVIDEEGVGELVRIAVQKGRSVKPHLKMGVCGEVGGDPKAIDFFHRIGLNYVSCSPFRVPVARLAAAQAAIRHD